jgi:dihydrodipicolinate synthase/N-acetylneuraminate lyase
VSARSGWPGLRERLKTVHTYAVTPFHDDDLLRIDHDALAANLGFLVDEGIGVIAVGGGTGEVDALSPDELVAVARTAVAAAAGRAVVVAGLPGNLAEAGAILPAYEAIGVDVVLALAPLVRWKPPADSDGVVDYYRAIGGRTGLPLMPYNTQGWDAEMFVRLADVGSIIGIKDPCVDDLPMFRAIGILGDRYVWIGNKRHDPGIVHLRYQMGMQGFTSGMTNFLPRAELALHEAAVDGDWERCVRLQARFAELERARRASDDAAMVKACMDLSGLCGGRVRPPRRDVPASSRGALEAALATLTEALVAELEGR